MTKFFDAFISYGRADSKKFAEKLQSSLNKYGFKVWFDFNDIPLGVDFQNQIDDGIEKADHFLFVISPHSINSPYCLKEIELAIKCNKRIIPLLHVDEINRETWLSRNPNGTDEEWELYKAQGKHTCFVNMHPTISKINWVYFQEGKNDFDKSLADLVNLLGLHGDYVQQHTRFLNKALEWERNQKQTSYLLVGEEKQLAQNWLKIRFCEEQPPCVPSDLHCEYITESIKNGNNLMTRVFLSYAEQDRATMEKIRALLRREGITVWTNTTDIHTGEDFVNSFKRGIEKADNLVYLLSPDSIKSNYTQQELDLAVEFNKRIIPLLVQKTDNLELPFCLQDLQYIDFTDNFTEADYQLDESELLKILYEDAAYYNEHKILLTKALKWQQQNHNPSILLRGYNLRSAQTWLEVAQKRTQHPPIPLQSEFITASLQQPPLESLDVFISYSRADSDLARKLNDALQLQGKTTWFDQESIASGSDFQQEINRGIKTSDNFVFILSPRSVNSPYCKGEVEYAASLNKRFVTVLHREVDTNDLHPELAKVQWIGFNSNKQDFNANFNQLLRTIETDRQHVHSHSKWLQRALEWEYKNKNDDLLLRGSNLIIAQNWLEETENKKKKPAITVLQKEFIQASQKAVELAEKEEKLRQERMLRLQEEKIAEQKKSAKKQKFFLGAVSIALVGAVIFAIKSTIAEGKAEEARKDAITQKREAQKAQVAQLNSASRSSLLLSKQNLKFDALLEAIGLGKQIQEQSLPVDSKTRSSILTALQTAVYEDGFREQNRLTGHESVVFDVAWSPDGKTIATASGDGKIKLWNLNGKEIKTIPVSNDSNNLDFYSVSFRPDGKTIATAHYSNNTIKLWNLNNSSKINSIRLPTMANFYSFRLSRDGKTIATNGRNGIRLWNVNNDEEIEFIVKDNNNKNLDESELMEYLSLDDKEKKIVTKRNFITLWSKQGKLLQTITNDDLRPDVTWSPKDEVVATVQDNTVKLWDIKGDELKTLVGHKYTINSVKFSPDGKTIATASNDNTVKLWRKSRKEFEKFKGDNEDEYPFSVALSSDGKTIAYGISYSTFKFWTKKKGEWKFIQTEIKYDHYANFNVSFSPDGQTIASEGLNNTIKLWNNKGKSLREIGKHDDSITSVAWSPDGNTIASASRDKTIKLWSKFSEEIKTLKKHKGAVSSVAWSPDGNTIASASSDNTIKLWNNQGKYLRDLGVHADVRSVAWSSDGNIITSVSHDKTIKLWSKKGNKFDHRKPENLKWHQDDVSSVTFSHDGQKIATGSKDGTVKLWNINGEELQTLYGHNNKSVSSVSFSLDSKTLASASRDGTVIVWNLQELTLDKLMDAACQQVKDYLESNATKSEKDLCKSIRN